MNSLTVSKIVSKRCQDVKTDTKCETTSNFDTHFDTDKVLIINEVSQCQNFCEK